MLDRGVVPVGIQDELGALVVVLAGREGPVDDVDLALRTLEEKGLNIVTESDLLMDDDTF